MNWGVGFDRVYHLTENYYIINSETIMDVNNYISFSIINSQMIDVMYLWCSKHWASSQSYTALNYIADKLIHNSLLM